MSVEFIGYVSAREQTEILDPSGPAVDPEYIAATALIHERGGFDKALVAFHSSSPESILIAQHAASVTSKMGFLIAHRPGFTAPTLAARQFATLDTSVAGEWLCILLQVEMTVSLRLMETICRKSSDISALRNI